MKRQTFTSRIYL